MPPRPTSHHLATTFRSVLSSSAARSLQASAALFLAGATQVCSRHPSMPVGLMNECIRESGGLCGLKEACVLLTWFTTAVTCSTNSKHIRPAGKLPGSGKGATWIASFGPGPELGSRTRNKRWVLVTKSIAQVSCPSPRARLSWPDGLT